MTTPQETRERILAAALKCFQRYGHKKTTIDEIARTAGVGKGTVYIHFRDKDDLFIATIEHKMQELRAVSQIGLESEPDAIAKCSRMLSNAVRYLDENPLLANLINPASEAGAPHLWPLILKCQGAAVSLVEEILQAGVVAGELAVANVRLTASFLFSAYHSHFIQGIGKEAGTSEEFIHLINQVARHGLVAPARKEVPS